MFIWSPGTVSLSQYDSNSRSSVANRQSLPSLGPHLRLHKQFTPIYTSLQSLYRSLVYLVL